MSHSSELIVIRPLVICLGVLLLSGCGMPSLLITPVSNTNELREETVQSGRGWSPRKVVIIPVEGMLMNAKSGGLLQPTENPVSLFTQQLNQAAADPKVAAVVLRINSPGGTVTASDTMYQELTRFKQKTGKPVIASSQEVAASGAYYLACGADQIVVHPTSIVGSVGVIFEAFDLEGTLQKLGIRATPIQSGPYKDMGSPFRARRADETALMQEMVNEFHQRFVGVVKAHRPISDPQQLATVTSGRVFSGQQAVEMGLADATGLLDDAIDLAGKKANVAHPRVITYKRPYGYGGSIYAQGSIPAPQAGVMQLSIPALEQALPAGFYYLWKP